MLFRVMMNKTVSKTKTVTFKETKLVQYTWSKECYNRSPAVAVFDNDMGLAVARAKLGTFKRSEIAVNVDCLYN